MPAQSSADGGASSRRQVVKTFIDDAAEEYDDDEPESEDEDALADLIRDDESVSSGYTEIPRWDGASNPVNGNRATTLFEGIIQRFEHQPMDGTDDGGSPSSSRLLESEEVLDVDRIKDDNFYLMAVAHDESRTIVHYDFDRVDAQEDAVRNIKAFAKDEEGLLEAWAFHGVKPRLYLLLQNSKNLQAINQRVARGCPTVRSSSMQLVTEPNERAATLRLMTQRHPWQGRWVNIRKGRYRDDVGYVVVDDGQWVELLVVPRLSSEDFHPVGDRATVTFNYAGKRPPSPTFIARPGKKRKLVDFAHPSRPLPALLNNFHLTPRGTEEGRASYLEYPGLVFEGDLLVLRCRPLNLRVATHVSQQIWELLMDSNNESIPLISLPPRPEWTLEYGERVFDYVTGLTGFVGTIEDERISVIGSADDAEVLGDEEVLGWIPRANVVKFFDDYEPVEAPFPGGRVLNGWVWPQKNKRRYMDVLVVQEQEDGLVSEMFTFTRNACRTAAFARGGDGIYIGPRHAAPTRGFGPQPSFAVQENPGANVGRCPWIGIQVSIIGSGRTAQRSQDLSSTHFLSPLPSHVHRMNDIADDYKGRVGYVLSGDLSKDSRSGVLLDISLLGNAHEKIIRTDYEYVVDARTGWPLRIAHPRRNTNDFWAGNAQIQRKEKLVFRYRQETKVVTIRDSTPPPSPPPLPPPSISHWTLSPELHGHRMQVKSSRSAANRPDPFWVIQERVDPATVLIRQVSANGKPGKPFEPSDLFSPGPGRKAKKYNRWFVNAGKHRGKFCRGIQYTTSDPKYNMAGWVVFQVELVPGEADRDLGTTFRVSDMDLVVLAVDDDDRKLNAHHEKRRVSSQAKVTVDEDAWDPES